MPIINNMPRPKGSKNKTQYYIRNHTGVPMPVRTIKQKDGQMITKIIKPLPPEVQAKIVALDSDNREKLPTIPKWAKNDREYLFFVWDVFKENIVKMIPEGFPDDANGNYRYLPMQMWDGMRGFIETSIRFGQPVTMSGIAVFSGMRVNTLTMIRSNPKLHPAYHFIRYVSDFVEMYNEFSAHKKINPAAAIFILKNMGWKDKFEIEASATSGALTDDERRAAQERIQKFSE